MECDYCGRELLPHESVVRGDGRMYCGVCIGRLTGHMEYYDDMADYLPA